MKKSDGAHMNRDINRRGFLNGASIAIAGAVLAPGAAGAQARDDSPAPGTPPLIDRSPSNQSANEDLPLEPERTIEFTTDEGTWISLDLSRDGETILFELLGDLYTVPLTGGDAVAITSGMAFNSQPRYSPNGEQIVFVLGHPEYYPRFGFSADLAAPFDSDWSGEAFMALRLHPNAPASGRLTYPPAFG